MRRTPPIERTVTAKNAVPPLIGITLCAKMKLHRILARLFRWRHSAPASTARIVYALPDISVYKKLYNQGEFFHDVDWNNWNSVVDGFKTRFEKWYFDHMTGGHASYVDLCSLCALVEVFSHYYSSEKEWHEPKHYKEFLRKLDPVFRKDLEAPVQITRYEGGRWKRGELKDYADVFYAGVRCSLHHHGDLASFAGMSGTGQLAVERANAGRSLCGTYGYPLVIFDPGQLKLRLHEWLRNYCESLKQAPGGSVAADSEIDLRRTLALRYHRTLWAHNTAAQPVGYAAG